MIALGTFALLRPAWLLALPLLMLAMLLTRAGAGGLADWPRAIDPPLLAAMLRRGAVQGGGRTGWNGLLAVGVLVILGLAGPALLRPDAGRLRNLDATLVVIDLSREAVQGHLLAQAQTAAQRLLEFSGGRQLGLVLYAGDAYLASPLTNDAAAMSSLLFALDAETVPDPGVRPERALALARQVLEEAKILRGNVVLVSSGAGLGASASVQAHLLAAAGHRLDTLFLPGDNATGADRRAGLEALAALGGGMAADISRAEPVLLALSGQGVLHFGRSGLNVLAYQEFGRWLLVLAALPLLLAFRREAA